MDLRANIPVVPGAQISIVRLREDLATPLQHDEALLIRNQSSGNTTLSLGTRPAHRIALPPNIFYLREGDIIRVNESGGELRVLYRKNSKHNVLFLTERCNSRCLMCSQPPRFTDDGFLVDEILEAIPLISPQTPDLCITGGEPTLAGPKLIDVLQRLKEHLPRTSIHILSNGRLFRYAQMARRVAEINHPDLMIGIPVYSDVASRHDFIVQSRGAFDETIRGITNLARVGQRIEIRFVIHKQSFERLPHTARFISKNLPFVSQVALMGLEITGFTKSNLEALWIDPIDYRSQLEQAVDELGYARIPTMIYNHQLCLVPKQLWQITRRSISDWKNIYMPECAPCAMKKQCGGFFVSANLRYSKYINPFVETL